MLKKMKTASNQDASKEDHPIQEDADMDENPMKPEPPEDVEEEANGEEAAQESHEAADAEEQVTVNAAEYKKICFERDDYLNHLQRLQAEFENYRKRVFKEKSELRDYLIQDFISSLLNVIDNMERSLHPDNNTNDVASYRQGVEMVFQQMLSVLKEKGLTRIDAVGRKFDPRIHEAVHQMETDEYEPGVITEEFLPGYMIKDRVLRAPKVLVAAKPSEPESKEIQENGAASKEDASQ